MPDEKIQLTDLQEQINRLKNEMGQIAQLASKNNFSSSQTFSKDVVFSSRLRVPVFSSAPTVAEVGDIIAINGILYICTIAGTVATPATFTAVGTQS